jgi:hypothetical protein
MSRSVTSVVVIGRVTTVKSMRSLSVAFGNRIHRMMNRCGQGSSRPDRRGDSLYFGEDRAKPVNVLFQKPFRAGKAVVVFIAIRFDGKAPHALCNAMGVIVSTIV